jgi:hypothetical protein
VEIEPPDSEDDGGFFVLKGLCKLLQQREGTV